MTGVMNTLGISPTKPHSFRSSRANPAEKILILRKGCENRASMYSGTLTQVLETRTPGAATAMASKDVVRARNIAPNKRMTVSGFETPCYADDVETRNLPKTLYIPSLKR